MSVLLDWDRWMLDDLGDRAAEDGEHGVVGAYQVLCRSGSTEEERREAAQELEAYLDRIS